MDLLQIHTPTPGDIQGGENDDMIRCMEEMKAAGKIGHICVSFKNNGSSDPKYPDQYSYECLKYFKDWNVFDIVQLVYGGLTRKCEEGINALAANGKGVIVRGSLKEYYPNYPELYRKSGLSELLEPGEILKDFLLRFTITHPGITTAIVGTKSAEHLLKNIRTVNKGPLSPDVYAKAKQLMDAVGQTSLPV